VLKAIKKSKVHKYHAEKALRNEIEVQSHLDHPNILRLFTFFHDQEHIYLLLEYAAGGDLFTRMRKSQLPLPVVALYTYEIAQGLKFMHKNHSIHRDLKPENIFLSHTGRIKIADFGWACHSHKPSQEVIVGTTQYMAPEMLTGNGYTCMVDVWSLGILFYEMLTGDIPFGGDSYEEIAHAILGGKYDMPGPGVPKGAVDLVTRLLTKNPAHRISLDDVMQNPWLVSAMRETPEHF
jgi:serine/threonine protein kinase